MNKGFVDSKEFNGKDFVQSKLKFADYEYCTFINCNFSNLDLSDISFTECEFEGCNLSNVQLNNTTLRETKFKSCKMLGVQFDKCNTMLFSIDFDTCQLNLSSFFKLGLKNTKFIDSSLKEVDFTESDLANMNFVNCDLSGAFFENTILRKADIRTAYNYSIDPELNQIVKAKFSLSEVKGLLDKFDIEIH
jgi:fluoroquinolone resistance protein